MSGAGGDHIRHENPLGRHREPEALVSTLRNSRSKGEGRCFKSPTRTIRWNVDDEPVDDTSLVGLDRKRKRPDPLIV